MSTTLSLEVTQPRGRKEAVLISSQNGSSTPEIVVEDEGIFALRQRLKQLGVWPDAADQILALMSHSRWQSPPLLESDYQWLPKVVEDSLQGTDIGANYPAFFQKLLASEDLRRTFLRALDDRSGMAS